MKPNGDPLSLAPQRLPKPRAPLKRVVAADESVVRVEEIVTRVHLGIVYDGGMTDRDKQREQLTATIKSAKKIRASLQHLLDAHGDRVHFRPAAGGVTMVGLLHDRPQRGEGFANHEHIVADFETLFQKHCRDIEQGRRTREKELQSFLIRESYTSNRRLKSINAASTVTNAPVDLIFVTDEIALPEADGKTVCDILALRRDGGRATPVLLELKTGRELKRLKAQVESYSALFNTHADLFAELFSELLGEKIAFDRPCEKWIVWPVPEAMSVQAKDPQEDKLRTECIRCVTYAEPSEGIYEFRVGNDA